MVNRLLDQWGRALPRASRLRRQRERGQKPSRPNPVASRVVALKRGKKEEEVSVLLRCVLIVFLLAAGVSLGFVMFPSAISSLRTSRPYSAVSSMTARMLSNHNHHHHKHQVPDTSHVHVGLEDASLIRHQAVHMLKQQLSVLKMLRPADYAKKNADLYNSSVGGHVRHSLDHFNKVIAAANDKANAKPLADYDHRQRETEVELNRDVAVDAIEKAVAALHSLDLTRVIQVSFIGDEKNFDKYTLESNVARELAFASHHAIHHMTLIKLLMSSMSYEFAKDSSVGIAPSTVKDMKQKGEL